MHARLRPIERLPAGTLGVERARPFVAPFCGASSARAVVEASASRRVPVRLWKAEGLCGIENHDHVTRGWAQLGDVVEYIESRERMFEDGGEDVSIFGPAHELLPELLERLAPPSDLPTPHCAHLWIGGRGQITSLHEDPWPNYNFQIQGRKRFIVFPPDQAPLLEPCEPGARRPGEYRFDATGSNHGEGAGTMVEGFEGYVCEGHVVYIPPRWPHQVVYESALAVNLSFWGAEPPSQPLEFPSSQR